MQQLCRFAGPDGAPRVGLLEGGVVRDLSAWRAGALATLDRCLTLARADLAAELAAASSAALPTFALGAGATLLKPIERQEVWAAGVTYLISREARVEESREKTVYERVYEAERPELFFKANAARTVGPAEPVLVRADSTWDVPEPELTLVLNADLELVGYTVGNDVSSRSIEGENPLYLPQAKIYRGCCALGPAIALAWELPEQPALAVRLEISRAGEVVYSGETTTAQIVRPFRDLIAWLGRDNTFPFGAFLLTGTGLVPPASFPLEGGDEVTITIEPIGTLRNPVRRGDGRYSRALEPAATA